MFRSKVLDVGPGPRRGRRDRHRQPVPVVAPLVPAERLPGGEAPVAHRAPVLPAARRRRVSGRRRRRRRLHLQQGRRRRRLPVAGLVPAQRLVRRERLAADGAPEAELALVLGRRRRPASSSNSSRVLPRRSSLGSAPRGGEGHEAEGDVVVVVADGRHGSITGDCK